MESYNSMYGVMEKNEITVCKTLKEAHKICNEKIKHNEFANYIMHCLGGYKIVELQINVIDTITERPVMDEDEWR